MDRTDRPRRRWTDTGIDHLDDGLGGLKAMFDALSERVQSVQDIAGLNAAQLVELGDALRKNTELTEKLSDHADELEVSQKRLEVGTKALVDFTVAAQGALTVMDWVAKIGAKIAWIAIPGAILFGGWQVFKQWIGLSK